MRLLRCFYLLLLPSALLAQDHTITMAATTSTQSSGLFEYLLPQFTQQTGITIKVVAVGTGRAIRLASRGDADVLFTHHRQSEDQFIADGFGLTRHDVMQNNFILIGPEELKPDLVAQSIGAQFSIIANKQFLFASRGDDSGTHKKELSIWRSISVDPSIDSGKWYREIGAGQGTTLNIAMAMGGFALVDQGTWLNYANKSGYTILSKPHENLINPYSIILVNPQKFPHVNHLDGQRFIDWLTSAKGQNAIATYQVDGQQLFKPTAQQ